MCFDAFYTLSAFQSFCNSMRLTYWNSRLLDRTWLRSDNCYVTIMLSYVSVPKTMIHAVTRAT